MTAKHSSKSRKGLLPPAAASKNAKSPKNVPVSEQKGAVISASPSKQSTSTAAKKPEQAKIDKYTGKKKGTLFSSAPSPASKDGLALKKSKAFKKTSTAVQKPGSTSHGAGVDAKGEPKAKKKHRHTVAGPVDCVAQIKSKKKWKRKKAKAATVGEGRQDEAAILAPPTNKGATGKCNWERLKAQALEQSEAVPSKASQSQSAGQKVHKKRKRQRAFDPQSAAQAADRLAASSEGILDGKLVPKNDNTDKTEIVALDCEMVGVGNNEGRKRDALARASLVRFENLRGPDALCQVNRALTGRIFMMCAALAGRVPGLKLNINDAGNVLLDVWVRPKEKVTDYRFHVTGIKWSDLKDGISVEEASRRMHELTKDSILVGHAVHNDIKVLALQGTIPRSRIRDTALYPPLMGVRKATGKLFSKSLKNVALEELGIKIQKDEHDPVQDARAALYVYHKHRISAKSEAEKLLHRRQVWEMQVSTGSLHQPGVRTSAKLTRGVPQQKRMRVDTDEIQAPKVRGKAQGTEGGDTEAGSDDEFAPPDALAIARMKAKLKGDSLQDHMADL